MTTYYIDFETRSSVPISNGVHNYLTSPHSAIVCMAWGRQGETMNLWLPGQPPPFQVRPEDTVYAFNIVFDWLVWHVLGSKHGFEPFKLDRCVDAMALCGRFTLFQNLQQAGETLNLSVVKDRRGKTLIKKICTPPFKYTKQDLKEFYVYCVRDAQTLHELVHTLPMPILSPQEQKVWLLTQKMNLRGVPVDSYAIKRIYHMMQEYLDSKKRELPLITDGRITSHNQVTEIVKWAHSMGVELPNLTKATVTKFIGILEGDMTPNHYAVYKVLTIRQQLALTSTAKYKKLLELNHEGRIYENLRYHGAATGRWAGMGAQLHNLPRVGAEDPDTEIEKFYDRSILDANPLASAKALVRSMICAPPDRVLCVADYSAIENRVLMWGCDEFEALELIAKGADQYIDMASDLYNIGYHDVTKDQRALGKTLILGAGYNLGAKGFKAYAGGFGIDLSDNGAEEAIRQYRNKYKKVVGYWYAAKDTMIHAIQNPGIICEYGKCTYQVITDHVGTKWLVLTLPSGRALFYNKPDLKEDKYGLLPTHMGINSYTRKWDRLKLIPGRIIENIVQATSRDILADGKLRMDKVGLDLVLSVHDEAVVEADESVGLQTLNDMIGMMRVAPEWGEGLPLDADGFVTKRYKK